MARLVQRRFAPCPPGNASVIGGGPLIQAAGCAMRTYYVSSAPCAIRPPAQADRHILSANQFLRLGVGGRPDRVEKWIALPIIDGGFTPANAAFGNADLFREGALLDLSVQGCTAETRSIKNRIDAQKAIWYLRDDKMILCHRITFPRRRSAVSRHEPGTRASCAIVCRHAQSFTQARKNARRATCFWRVAKSWASCLTAIAT